MDLKVMLDRITSIHRKFYAQDPHGELAPKCFLFDAEGAVVQIIEPQGPAEVSEDLSKTLVKFVLAQIVAELGDDIQAVGWASEAWSSTRQADQDLDQRASEDPNREETVVTAIKTRDGQYIGSILKITRNESGAVISLEDTTGNAEFRAYMLDEILPTPERKLH